MEVVEDFLYLISSSSANNIQVIKPVFTDIFFKKNSPIYLNENILTWKDNLQKQIWLRGVPKKLGRISAGSKITSILAANDIILCGTEMGQIKVRTYKQTTHVNVISFCIWWHWPNHNCSTGMDSSVGRAFSTTYCAYIHTSYHILSGFNFQVQCFFQPSLVLQQRQPGCTCNAINKFICQKLS